MNEKKRSKQKFFRCKNRTNFLPPHLFSLFVRKYPFFHTLGEIPQPVEVSGRNSLIIESIGVGHLPSHRVPLSPVPHQQFVEVARFDKIIVVPGNVTDPANADRYRQLQTGPGGIGILSGKIGMFAPIINFCTIPGLSVLRRRCTDAGPPDQFTVRIENIASAIQLLEPFGPR